MDNLVLIGMPSSGKSTAGVLLAKRIGFGFIDSDLLIQGEEGTLLSEIISRRGAEGFLRIEERITKGLYATHCVIATGGSAIYNHSAMEHLRSIGTIVYLKLDLASVLARIPSFARRGVVMRGNITTLEELYEERIPFYEKYAQITVDCSGKTIDEVVESVMASTGFEV